MTPRFWILGNDGQPMLVSALSAEVLAQYQRDRARLTTATKAMRCASHLLIETIARAQAELEALQELCR